MLGRFPPPAAGAKILARFDRASAGSAADGRVTAVMERIVRHVMGANVGPDVLGAPIGERVEFGEAVRGVELLERQVASRDRLLAPLAGDPRGSLLRTAQQPLRNSTLS